MVLTNFSSLVITKKYYKYLSHFELRGLAEIGIRAVDTPLVSSFLLHSCYIVFVHDQIAA